MPIHFPDEQQEPPPNKDDEDPGVRIDSSSSNTEEEDDDNNNDDDEELPILGNLSVRVDLTTRTFIGNVNGILNNSVYTVKGWFKISPSSTSSHESVWNSNRLALGATILLSLWCVA